MASSGRAWFNGQARETSVEGLADLNKVLETLPQNIERNVIRGALRAGLNVMRGIARDRVPVRTGALKKSIKVKAARSKKKGRVALNLVAGDQDAWYAHIVEFGSGSFYEGTGRKSKRRPYEIRALQRAGRTGPAIGKKALTVGPEILRASALHPGIHPVGFMRAAADAGSQKAVDEFIAYLRKRLPQEIAKAKTR